MEIETEGESNGDRNTFRQSKGGTKTDIDRVRGTDIDRVRGRERRRQK